jgi:aminoglycoside phosphotransferase
VGDVVQHNRPLVTALDRSNIPYQELHLPMLPLPGLPSTLRQQLIGTEWADVTFGYSGMRVFRLTETRQPPRYLKLAQGPLRRELRAEFDALAWLKGHLPVPEALAYAEDAGFAYLLLSEVSGIMSCDAAFADDVPALVRLLAAGLQQFHALDYSTCPLDQRLNRKLALAAENLAAGLVDEAEVDARGHAEEAAGLLRWLTEHRPATEDLVFTHGDYCLPNILINAERTGISGFIDLGRAGVADRYQDLALAARSLTYNFGPGWEPLLWEAYGLASVDAAKLEYYVLLDELF